MKQLYEIIKPWLVPIVAGFVIVLLVISWNNARRARNDLQQELDRAKLAAAGIAADAEVTARDLKSALDEMTRRSKALADEVQRLHATVPGTTPVVVAHGSTGPLPATPLAPPASAGQDGQVPAQAGAVPAACLVAPGDPVEVRCDVVAERTRSGVIAVVGSASAWTKGIKLVEGPLKLDVKSIEQEKPIGWGAGAILVGGRDGWWVGPIIALPPAHILGLEINALLGGGVGTGGTWGGAASAFARW
jgi:hypothetical protein